MSEENQINSSNVRRSYAPIIIGCTVGVFIGSWSNIFLHEMTYMQVSAVAGAGIPPALLGALCACILHRFVLRLVPFGAGIAVIVGAAIYAVSGSFLVEAINGVQPPSLFPGHPGKSLIMVTSASVAGCAAWWGAVVRSKRVDKHKSTAT